MIEKYTGMVMFVYESSVVALSTGNNSGGEISKSWGVSFVFELFVLQSFFFGKKVVDLKSPIKLLSIKLEWLDFVDYVQKQLQSLVDEIPGKKQPPFSWMKNKKQF